MNLKKLPTVSIIILSFNGEAYLANCLDSLRKINYPKNKLEIIIVDNASKDKSVEIIKRYPECKLIQNKKNSGFAGGNNIGFRKAKGGIIVMLNQDTTVEKNWLKELVKVFEIQGVGIAGSKIMYPDKKTLQFAGAIVNMDLGFARHIGYQETDTGQYEKISDTEYAAGCSLAFKKELLYKMGPLDSNYFPAYYEETDFCYRAKKRGYRLLYVPKSIVYHFEAASTKLKSYNFYYWTHKHRLRFIIKNSSPNNLLKFPINEFKWILACLFTPTVKYGASDELKTQIKAYIFAYMFSIFQFPELIHARYSWRNKKSWKKK